MNTEVQAAVALLASCALILPAAFLLEQVKLWGARHRLGDLPVGVMMGIISLAQMHHPIEPYPGFIFDLRVIPLVLCGAFTGWPPTLIAIAIAAGMRLQIGGDGALSGVVAITLAGVMGLVWQGIKARIEMKPKRAYMLLGALSTISFSAGLLLPDLVRSWFLFNAVPVLMILYITVIPLLAWIISTGFYIERLDGRTAQRAMARQNVKLLSLPVFVHQMRTDAILDKDSAPSAVICLRIDGLDKRAMKSASPATGSLLDAVMRRLIEAFPDMSMLSSLGGHTVLLPVTGAQVKKLDQITEALREALQSAPFQLSKEDRHWVSFELRLMSPDAFYDGPGPVAYGEARSRFTKALPIPSEAGGPAQEMSSEIPPNMLGKIKPLQNMDILFLKAAVLMEDGDS